MPNEPKKFDLDALMKLHGYDRESLATALKCTVWSLDKWRKGQEPNPKNKQKIADLFGMSVAELFYPVQTNKQKEIGADMESMQNSLIELYREVLRLRTRVEQLESRQSTAPLGERGAAR